MSRIGIIREAIVAEGGKPPQTCGLDYYADGPDSDAAHYSKQHRLREAIYKIDNMHDGLTVEARERVVEALRKHPEVKTAYLSRPYKHKTYLYGKARHVVSQGHIKVVFDGGAYD